MTSSPASGKHCSLISRACFSACSACVSGPLRHCPLTPSTQTTKHLLSAYPARTTRVRLLRSCQLPQSIMAWGIYCCKSGATLSSCSPPVELAMLSLPSRLPPGRTLGTSVLTRQTGQTSKKWLHRPEAIWGGPVPSSFFPQLFPPRSESGLAQARCRKQLVRRMAIPLGAHHLTVRRSTRTLHGACTSRATSNPPLPTSRLVWAEGGVRFQACL